MFRNISAVLSRYSRHRANSRTCSHKDQAKRIYESCHDNLRVTFKRWIHTVGDQQRNNLESGKEELPCRVIKIATATAIVVVIDSDQPQPPSRVSNYHTTYESSTLHSINTQATDK